LSSVNTSLSKVNSLAIGVDGAGVTGVIYVDDIALYRLAPLVLDATLVAYWNMDEAAGTTVLADTAGYEFANDAVVNTDNVTTGLAGKFGNALQQPVDGESNISAPDTGLPMGRDSVSVSLWFNASEDELATQGVFLSYGNSAVGQMTALDTNGSGGLRAWHYDADMSAVVPAGGITPDTWNLLVYTLDFTNNQQKIYLNNTLVTTQGVPVNVDVMPDSDVPSVEIGGWERTNGNFPQGAFHGLLDDVAVWSGVLKTDDVAALWNNGAGVPANSL